jgi:hypothetical protein
LEPNNIFEPESETDSSPEPRTTIDWTIWIQWVLVTTLGWILGIVLGGEIGVGVFIGLAQWFVLRRYFSSAWGWILASAAGWIFGWAIITSGLFVPPGGGLFTAIVSGAIFGLSMGVAQWLVLRRWVRLSGLWILLSIPGWTIGLIGLLGSILAGAAAGVITGFAFDFLLRFPHKE